MARPAWTILAVAVATVCNAATVDIEVGTAASGIPERATDGVRSDDAPAPLSPHAAGPHDAHAAAAGTGKAAKAMEAATAETPSAEPSGIGRHGEREHTDDRRQCQRQSRTDLFDGGFGIL